MKTILFLIFVFVAGMASAQSGQVKADSVITGIEDEKIVSVYPNPASGILSVDCEEQNTTAIADMHGRQVYVQAGTNQKIDLKEFASGIYILRVSTQSHRYVRRVLIL